MSAVAGTEPGDLMSRVTADTTLLREVTTNSLVQAITGALTLTATVLLMVCWTSCCSLSRCRCSWLPVS
jgi:hypothetical protein